MNLRTLPVVRAVIMEILTAHFFVTRPRYLRTMQKLAEIDLGSEKVELAATPRGLAHQGLGCTLW